MAHSIFDLFKISIGLSSSRTVRPMVAGNCSLALPTNASALTQSLPIQVNLYASLAMTDKNYASDIACTLGFLPQITDQVESDKIPVLLKNFKRVHNLPIFDCGNTAIEFDPQADIIFNFSEHLSKHPYGMAISAFNETGEIVLMPTYFSVGSFVLENAHLAQEGSFTVTLPYSFESARELLRHYRTSGLSNTGIVLANDQALGMDHIIDKSDVHHLHLDDVIKTVHRTGLDMMSEYKEPLKAA